MLIFFLILYNNIKCTINKLNNSYLYNLYLSIILTVVVFIFVVFVEHELLLGHYLTALQYLRGRLLVN